MLTFVAVVELRSRGRRCRSSLIQPIRVDLRLFAVPHARLRCPCGLNRVKHFLAGHASGNMDFTKGLRRTLVVVPGVERKQDGILDGSENYPSTRKQPNGVAEEQ